MPPARGRKVISTASTKSNNQDHQPTTLAMVPTKQGGPVTTPSKSPSKRKIQITQSQKQALLDNLQLEITERARKMRAQYALQAQGLKTRLEIRVHRIPAALRKTTIAELLEKYSDQANIKPASITNDIVSRDEGKGTNAKPVAHKFEGGRGIKRKSGEYGDENDNTSTLQAEQKKQPRTANTAAPSRTVPASQILSPKSNNSRTLPRSPFKATMSPTKSNMARLMSPLKPSSTAPTATSLAKTMDKPSKPSAAASRAASKQDKTTATTASRQTRLKGAIVGSTPALVDEKDFGGAGRTSNISDAASSSAGTTIVRTTRKGPPSSKVSGVTKGKVAGVKAKFEGIAGNGKKVAAAKVVATAPVGIVKGGRTLRKRA